MWRCLFFFSYSSSSIFGQLKAVLVKWHPIACLLLREYRWISYLWDETLWEITLFLSFAIINSPVDVSSLARIIASKSSCYNARVISHDCVVGVLSRCTSECSYLFLPWIIKKINFVSMILPSSVSKLQTFEKKLHKLNIKHNAGAEAELFSNIFFLPIFR